MASFFTTSLSLLSSVETGTNLSMSDLPTSIFKLAKLFLVQNVKYQHVKYF